MTSNEIAVIVWTVQAAIGVLFSGAMMLTRHRNLLTLERSTGNGDREYRIFLARQDIRRSLVRYLAFLLAFVVGVLFVVIEYTDRMPHPPAWLLKHWIWLLSGLMTLVTANEVADHWALHHLRSMYRHQHTEYHPDLPEGNDI